MEFSLKTKYLIIAAIIVALTAVTFSVFTASVALVTFIAQVGLFSAIMVSGFKPWQLLVPAFSYGLAYLFTGDPAISALSLLYVPVSIVVAVCLKKQASRGLTVVLASLTVGVLIIGSVALAALLSGVIVTADGITAFISKTVNTVASSLVAVIPDSLFKDGITKEWYTRMVVEMLKYSSFSFGVLLCNVTAFSATAVTKRVVLYLEDEKSGLTSRIKNWLFVLSKPSALMFLVCYLCLLVGGETLTLPQQVAFNTVMTAIQGGVYVMAFRYLRQKVSINGFASIFIYVVVLCYFGWSAAAVVLSGVGVFYALRQKSKEDDKKCEN